MKKIKLYTYISLYLLRLGLSQPQNFVIELHKLNQARKTLGKKAFHEFLIGDYLPKKYLLKKKLVISQASPSIYKKVTPFLPKDYFNSTRILQAHSISTPSKILLIRSGAMGDVLLATPIIREIYQRRNGFCTIDVATRYPELFSNNPYINKVITPDQLLDLEESYELIINLDMALEKNKAAHVTHAYFFQVFGFENHSGISLQPDLFTTTQDQEFAAKISEQFPNGYIVSHNRYDPSQLYRNVPVQQWEKILTELHNLTQLPILQVGSLDMDVYISGIHFYDYRGQLSIHQLKEVIQRAKLFLGTDAGPLHIAATTDTPIACFFTLAHHDTRKPLRKNQNQFEAITPQIDCYGCVKDYPLPWGFECRRGDFYCTQSFSEQVAIESCLKLLAGNSKDRTEAKIL